MQDIIKIDNTLAMTMGQVTLEQLQYVADRDFKSVINLRSPDESGFVTAEAEQAEELGLNYINIPVRPSEIDRSLIKDIIDRMETISKPTLIHCKSGMRSGLIALIYHALEKNMSAAEVLDKGQQLGISFDSAPKIKQLLQDYLQNKDV